MANPTSAAMGSTPSSGVPEPPATAPPTPIKARPTVYVRPDSAANILAQAARGSVVIQTVAANTPLTVVARDRGWLKVLVPGMTGRAGWVHTSGLQSDAGGIRVGPPTETTALPVTTGATKAFTTQGATEAVPGAISEAMIDEEMMTSGIGEMPMPSGGASSALPESPRLVAPSTTPAPDQGSAGSDIPAQTAAIPGYRIQLLSTKSAADTQEGWRQLHFTYPDLLAGLQFEVVEVDLGADKGVWYRGLAGPIADRDEANMLCAVIRSRPPHHDCFVANR
jgi:SPOR domain